ncbi:MAG: tetratricopeptide repeat protein [Gemmataceae bacterium]|nr:tetratricopeptide repeat protein [Gemmataceae bacterium]MDW8266140.1 tetratricopeptide repeat protein [Gemmataceae bacterium]
MCRWISGPVTVLALCLSGCAALEEDLLREYTDDGIFLYRQGDYAAARESFQAALSLKPNDTALLYNVGECYARQGAIAKAQHHFEECLRLDPGHRECRRALVTLLVRAGRAADARQALAAWQAEYPQDASAYAAEGWYWRQLGDLPRAQSCLQRALELDPRHCHALNDLALIYEALNRPDRAVALYERSLEIDPNQGDVLGRLTELRGRGAGRPRMD